MVSIPFAANQNLSVFCMNTKRSGCAGCLFHAPDVLCSPQIRRKLINYVPLTRRMRMAQCVSGTLMHTQLKRGDIYLKTSGTECVKAKCYTLVTILHSTVTSRAYKHKQQINGWKGVKTDFFLIKSNKIWLKLKIFITEKCFSESYQLSMRLKSEKLNFSILRKNWLIDPFSPEK